MTSRRHVFRQPVFWLGCLAAILYSSWPLAFILDPRVGRHELASMLEAPHAPYNWVFIAADVLTGITVTIMAVTQLPKWRISRIKTATILGYWLFGLLVGVAAMTPLECDPQVRACGSLLQHPLIIVHGFASIGSCIALLASLLLLGTVILQPTYNSKQIKIIYLLLVSGWALFGIGALAELLLHMKGNSLQYYFITVCSMTLLGIGVFLELVHTTNGANH